MSFLKILKVLTHESIFFKVEILPQSRNPICPFHFSNIIHWFNSNTTILGISNHCEVSRHILCLPSCCQSWSLTEDAYHYHWLPLTQCTLKTSLINVSKGSNYLAKKSILHFNIPQKDCLLLDSEEETTEIIFLYLKRVW